MSALDDLAPPSVLDDLPPPSAGGAHDTNDDNALRRAAGEFVANQATGMASTILGGYRGLYSVGKALVHGEPFDSALKHGAEASTKTQEDLTYQPKTEGGKKLTAGFSSKWNPLNWSSVAGDYVGGKLADVGLPGTGAVANAAITTAPMLLGLRKGAKAGESAPEETPIVEEVKGGPTEAATPTESLKVGQTLSPEAMTERAKVLQSVGFQDARQPAISGDHRGRAVEYQMSKFDEPAGQAAAKSFANEQQVLGDHVRGLIKDAGGTEGLDQGSLYARGQSIVRPIQALRDWFDDKASGLYKAADEKAQGQPVALGGFKETLADQSHWTNSDRVYLKDAATSYAKKLGMQIGDDGSFSGNALQAETMRKWLNGERTHANGRFVDALKDSLDNDVGQAAGGPIYDQARAMWKLRQQTLADPKGISSLLDEEGTNRTIDFDKVPNKVATMPQAQFEHIVNTLKDMPPEIQPVANHALGEIKAHYFNQMLKDATETRGGNGRAFWNGTGVKNVIANNSGKLQALLSPDELGKVDALRKAGDILSFDPSYPGAAAQAQNAVKQGLMSSIVRKASTATGAAIGGSVFGVPGAAGGAALGESVGAKAASAIGERQALKRWGEKNVPLKQIMSGTKE